MTWSAPSERTSSTFLVLQTRGYVRAERLRDLHGERPHAPRRTDDQDLLLWLHSSLVTKTLQGRQSGQRYRRRLLERQVGRLQPQRAFRNSCVLGETTRLGIAEDLIAWVKPRHVLADRLDLPCDVASEDSVLWFTQSGLGPHDVGQASHEMPVSGIGGGCTDAHEHLIVFGNRLVDVLELQDIG